MEKYISLKEASQFSGYHPDYLGFLIRKKKLKGKRLNGKAWLVEKSSLCKYLFLNSHYLSLKEAISSFLFKYFLVFIFISLFSLSYLFLKITNLSNLSQKNSFTQNEKEVLLLKEENPEPKIVFDGLKMKIYGY